MSGKPSNDNDDSDHNSNTNPRQDADAKPEEEKTTPKRTPFPLYDLTPDPHELNINPDINYWVRKKQEELERKRAEQEALPDRPIPAAAATETTGNETDHQHAPSPTPQSESAVLLGSTETYHSPHNSNI